MRQAVIRSFCFALSAVIVAVFSGCAVINSNNAVNESSEQSQQPEQTVVLPDLPDGRYDASAQARTGKNSNTPLVIASDGLAGNFNPFFAKTDADIRVNELTQIYLLSINDIGLPQVGADKPCLAYSFSEEVSADNTSTTYTILLKNGITFSDGLSVTISDVLFSVYTLCDPAYDGRSKLRSLPIQGVDEYINQAGKDELALAEQIVKSGISADDNGELKFETIAGVNNEQVREFWDCLDEAGALFCQEIIDRVAEGYISTDYVEAFMPGYSIEQVEGSADLKVALGMAMWGYGKAVDGIFTDAMGNKYELEKDTVNAQLFWENILFFRGYDLSDEGINKERAGEMRIEDYVKRVYFEKNVDAYGEIQNVSGITSGTMVCEDGVERNYIKLVLDGVNPGAVYDLAIPVAPFHYYTNGYSGELNNNGVDIGSREFMAHIKTKSGTPIGAGAYIFKSFSDGEARLVANDNYLMGSPLIETLCLKDTSGSGAYSVLAGSVDIAAVSKASILEDLAGEEGYKDLGLLYLDSDVRGYVGINAHAIPELEVRQAIACVMDMSLAINEGLAGLASDSVRTMSRRLWAYPANAQRLFGYDETGEASKALFISSGYEYDEGKNIMRYPKGHDKEGKQVTIKLALAGAAEDEPCAAVFANAKNVLAKIGVKAGIETDDRLNQKLISAYECGIEVWAAESSKEGPDPDMYSKWYSYSEEGTDLATDTDLGWLLKNGSDAQKVLLKELNDLIMVGRSTLDEEERMAVYARALEIATSLSVEIPSYQRQEVYVYDSSLIDAATFSSGDPLSEIWRVSLAG